MKREPVLTLAAVGAAVGTLADLVAPDLPGAAVSAIAAAIFLLARRRVTPAPPKS